VILLGASLALGLSHAVDICITTSMKALERVCLIAKALADRGYTPPPVRNTADRARWHATGGVREPRKGSHCQDLGP
jgi:hypothetical protein